MPHSKDPNSDLFDTYRDSYDEMVKHAIGLGGLGVDYFTKVKADYAKDLIHDHFGQLDQVSVLDIGCGIGNYHSLLQHDVGALTGIDVSPESLEVARQRHSKVDYHHYNGNKLPFEDASFDTAITICVMHHVPPSNWQAFANEMLRVLKPGGLALVFEHNPVNPLTRRIVDRCPFDADAVLLSQSASKAVFARVEEAVDIKTRTILSVPAGNAPLRTIDKLFSRLPFGAQYFLKTTKRETA